MFMTAFKWFAGIMGIMAIIEIIQHPGRIIGYLFLVAMLAGGLWVAAHYISENPLPYWNFYVICLVLDTFPSAIGAKNGMMTWIKEMEEEEEYEEEED